LELAASWKMAFTFFFYLDLNWLQWISDGDPEPWQKIKKKMSLENTNTVPDYLYHDDTKYALPNTK